MFNFGKRNIVSVNYTRYLALPKTWVDGVGLKEGGQVSIEMDETNRLLITAIVED